MYCSRWGSGEGARTIIRTNSLYSHRKVSEKVVASPTPSQHKQQISIETLHPQDFIFRSVHSVLRLILMYALGLIEDIILHHINIHFVIII